MWIDYLSATHVLTAALNSEYDRDVLRLIGRATTIFALCMAIGLHWLALQSVAWTTMLVDYSKRAPFCLAISQTFDGAHPCALCHAVSAGKSSEKKSDLQPAKPKIDIMCVARVIRLSHPFLQFEYILANSASFEFRHSPPVPPPRSSLS